MITLLFITGAGGALIILILLPKSNRDKLSRFVVDTRNKAIEQKDIYLLACRLLFTKHPKIKLASDNSNDAIGANKAYGYIEILNLNEVEDLLDLKIKSNYKRQTFESTGVIKKPELAKKLAAFKLPKSSIENPDPPE